MKFVSLATFNRRRISVRVLAIVFTLCFYPVGPALCDSCGPLDEEFKRPIQNFSAEEQPFISKARRINFSKSFFGIFAEIGGAQETSRFFFRAGQASSTIIRSVSDYAMEASTETYGGAPSFVSQARLDQMLTHHFKEISDINLPTKPASGGRFAFANTVTTKSKSGRGFIGIVYKTPEMKHSVRISLHAKMTHEDSFVQQVDLAKLGVNLISACHQTTAQDREWFNLLSSDLPHHELEIDMIKVAPEQGGFRAVLSENLQLNSNAIVGGLTDAVAFLPSGEPVSPAETFYRKSVRLRTVSATVPNLMEAITAALKFDGSSDAVRVLQLQLDSRTLPLIELRRVFDAASRADAILVLNSGVGISSEHPLFGISQVSEN